MGAVWICSCRSWVESLLDKTIAVDGQAATVSDDVGVEVGVELEGPAMTPVSVDVEGPAMSDDFDVE